VYFVPSIALRGIDSLIEQSGEDPARFFLDVGLSLDCLKQADSRVSGQQFNDLMEHAARQLNQRFFGLQLAKIQGASILGPLWFLLRNSATIREGIQNLLVNYPSHTEATFFATEETEHGTHFIYEVNPFIQDEHTQVIDLGLGISCLHFRRYIASNWQPKAVYFRASEPYEKRPLIEMFGPKLYFNQDQNSIFLTKQEVDLPIRGASKLQRLYYAHELSKRKDLNPRSAVVQTENIILASLTKHHCSLDFVAKCLNYKPRTLQYQLQQQGTSFQTLLQQAKLNLALRYLQQSDLSITEVAQRLHFAETAVFTRFVKKLTGKTPRQHRV